METVQIVLDKSLLQATDQAARRTKQNRSALVREALREHLKRLEVRASEERDRKGYARQPQHATNPGFGKGTLHGRRNSPRGYPPLKLHLAALASTRRSEHALA
jgi:predicted transcriptional regulator